MIVHPRFQNITADEAMEFLSDKDPGESIIRPSSRGPSYLTLTLKVYNGVYAHKDIVEGGKEHKDITSVLRIGKTLKIGEDTFEDLDEVMDRYVDPLVSYLKAMLSYRKFRSGTKAEVDELLMIEKSQQPTRIVYAFGICHEHPGTFILTYIRSTNPHHEYVGLYPKGFKFRKRQLLLWSQCEALQLGALPGVVQPMKVAGEGSLLTEIVLLVQVPGQDGMIIEVVVVEMVTRVGHQDHIVDEDVVHITMAEEIVVAMRGGILVMIKPKWDSGTKDGDEGWGSFPGAKVQNSPGKEAFPGGWGTGASSGGSGWGGGASGGDNSGWGGGASGGTDSRNSGRGTSSSKRDSAQGGWGAAGSGNGSDSGHGSPGGLAMGILGGGNNS
ncbi:hypothetical protein OIU78_003727 [Salix suchowensis]|nr:hypothetical protein OIU78_003727 [Salix suchowensis]